MSKYLTAVMAKYGLLGGEKLYQKRARLTLPFLVRLAKARQTIYYSDLATEINILNPRSFNYILGAIGDAIKSLSNVHNVDIPPIQCLVISKSSHLPGEGVAWFINNGDYSKLLKSQKKIIIDAELARIYTYNDWDWVLSELSLEPLTNKFDEELKKAKSIRGGGESEDHKRFKESISKNPQALKLPNTLKTGTLEYKLPSGDCIDVLFLHKDLKIGVEVKSKISREEDILRGIFQCVKYKTVLEAEQIVKNEIPNAYVILALEGKLPNKFILVKNLLGIEVIDEISI